MARVVLDLHRNLCLANQQTRTTFGLLPQDVGRPFYELDLSYRPVDLHSHIEQVYAERQAQQFTNVERALPDGRMQSLDVYLVPLLDTDLECRAPTRR